MLHTLKSKLLAASALAMAFSCPALAAPCPLDNPTSQSDAIAAYGPDVAMGCLENGIRYIVVRKPEIPASILFSVNVGSDDERPGEGGVPHVIEHIGLDEANPGTIYSTLIREGKIKVFNGNTGFKSTIYGVSIEKNAGSTAYNSIVELVKEWMLSAQISETSVARQRASVASESNGGEKSLPVFRVGKEIWGSHVHDLALRSYTEVEALNVDTVQRFYNRWYRPDLSNVVIVGDVDVVAWKKAIESGLGPLANPNVPNPRLNGTRESDYFIRPALGNKNRFLSIKGPESDTLMIALSSKRTRMEGGDRRGRERLALIRDIASEILRTSGKGTTAHPYGASDVSAETIGFLAPVPIESTSVPAAVSSKVEEGVKALRTLKRYGVSARSIRLAKRSIQKRPTPTYTAMSEIEKQLSDGRISGVFGGDYRNSLIEEITDAEINGYFDTAINLDTDFDIAIVGPSSSNLDTALIDSARRGFEAGMQRTLAPPENRVTLEKFSDSLSGVVPSGEFRIQNANTATLELAGGQTVVFQKLQAAESDSQVVILAGSRAPSTAYKFLSRQGLREVESTVTYVPPRVDGQLAADFVEDHGIKYLMTVRSDSAALRIKADSSDLSFAFQAARVALRTDIQELPVIMYSNATSTFAGERPDRHAEPSYEIFMDAMREFSPQYIVVSGNFDFEQARNLALKYLGDISGPKKLIAASRSPLPMKKLSKVFSSATPDDRGTIHAKYIYSADFDSRKFSNIALDILNKTVSKMIFDVHRKNGGYTAFSAYEYWPSSSRNKNDVVDLSVLFTSSDEHFPKFDEITSIVIRDIGSGKINPELFLAAKADALAEASPNVVGPPPDVILGNLMRNEPFEKVDISEKEAVERVTLEDVSQLARIVFSQALKDKKSPK